MEKYRVPKCDVIKNEICEIMGFVNLDNRERAKAKKK